MALFKKQNSSSGKLILLCDIGSARVAGALALICSGKQPQVLYRTESPIVFQEDLDFSRFTLSMLEALNSVLENIETQGLKHIHVSRSKKNISIDKVLCTYASPWHLSQTKTLHHHKSDKFKVTQELIDSIIETEGKKFAEKELAEYEESVGAEMELIEQQVTGVTLDGYTVHQPIGRETNELSFVVTVTIMAKNLKVAVANSIQKRIGTNLIAHHSFGYVGFIALRDAFPETNNFLLIDVTGEISDVSLVQNGMLLSSSSFPLGSRSLIRSVGKSHKIKPETAKSMVRGYIEDSGHSDVKEAIENAQHSWTMGAVDALNIMRSVAPLPKSVFCIVDEGLAPVFQDALSQAFKQMQTRHTQDDIAVLSTGMLHEHIDFRSGITEDPFIAMDVLYADRLPTC